MENINTRDQLEPYCLYGDDISVENIRAQLSTLGLVILPEYCQDQTSFAALNDSLASCYLDSPFGDRSRIAGEKNIQSVSIGKHPIDFHFEWGNLPFRPELLTFCCMAPPLDEGETTLVDSNKVLSALSAKSLALLQNSQLKYTDTLPSWVIDYYANKESMQNYFNGDFIQYLQSMSNYQISSINNDFVKTEFLTSAVTNAHFSNVPVIGGNVISSIYSDKSGQDSYSSRIQFSDDSDIPLALAEEIKTSMNANKLQINWRKGDAVLLDNTRFLHGRNRIIDAQRNILLASVYTNQNAA